MRAYHIAVPIESLHSTQQLLVVPEGDEDLSVVSNRSLEDRERSLGNLILLELTDLLVGKFGLGKVEQFTAEVTEEEMGGIGAERGED